MTHLILTIHGTHIVFHFSASWYFGTIKLPEAEHLLMRHGNEHGAFLIGNHDTKGSNIGADWFALSLKDGDHKSGDVVKHYRIKTTDSANYFIARRQEFDTLQDLITYYSENSDGLVTTLKKAALKVLLLFILQR